MSKIPLRRVYLLIGYKVTMFMSFSNTKSIGIFCFLCGTLGHSDSLCHKKFNPNGSDEVRGWGNSVRDETGVFRGNNNTNRWLRGGRNHEGGGRGAGDSKRNSHVDGSNDISVTDGQSFNAKGLNSRALKENNGKHLGHGGVLVDRHPISKWLVFFKFVDNEDNQVNGINS